MLCNCVTGGGGEREEGGQSWTSFSIQDDEKTLFYKQLIYFFWLVSFIYSKFLTNRFILCLSINFSDAASIVSFQSIPFKLHQNSTIFLSFLSPGPNGGISTSI